jgi:hypothetical protein
MYDFSFLFQIFSFILLFLLVCCGVAIADNIAKLTEQFKEFNSNFRTFVFYMKREDDRRSADTPKFPL